MKTDMENKGCHQALLQMSIVSVIPERSSDFPHTNYPVKHALALHTVPLGRRKAQGLHISQPDN